MLCGVNYFEIQISFKTIRRALNQEYVISCSFETFQVPESTTRPYWPCPPSTGPLPFPACRPRTPFQLNLGYSVPTQSILLLCLFADISSAPSPFATDGIPGINCGPGSGAADGPCYQPTALPAMLSPCGTMCFW